ncbi:MAG: tetratricopeptide repeat protein [Asgard group archaeon]|nr:tetratricopeptide repeat protein [Asgard group archaeon]
MSSTVKKQIIGLEQKIIQGSYSEAIKQIDEINRKKNLTLEDKLALQIMQSEILNRQGKYQEVLEIVDNIKEECIKINNPLLEIDALIQKSEALMRINNLKQHKSAVKAGDKILSTLKELQPKIMAKRKALILAQKSWIPFLIGEFNKSLELSQEGLVHAEKSENQLIEIQQLYSVGWNFLFLEKFELAEHYFNKGYKLAEKIGNKQEIAYGCHSLAAIANKNRNFAEAKKLWQKAIEINKEIGTERDLPVIYNELGYLYRNRLELDLALDCFLKIIEMTGESIAGVHIIMGNLGYLYYVKGLFEEAEKYFLLALAKCEEIGDKKRYLPIILRNLVRLSTDKKDLKKAKAFLKKIESLYIEIDEKRIKRAFQFA